MTKEEFEKNKTECPTASTPECRYNVHLVKIWNENGMPLLIDKKNKNTTSSTFGCPIT